MTQEARRRSSLDGAGGHPEGGAGGSKAKSTAFEIALAARTAIKSAPISRCPHAKPSSAAFNFSAGKAVLIPCGAWGCVYCGFRKRAAAAHLIKMGIVVAHYRGERCRFITLTENPNAPFESVGQLSAAWNRLRTILKREGLLNEYVCAIERTERGRLHLHAVATGAFIPQRKLSEFAERAGFGRVSDIRAIQIGGLDDNKKTANYIAKELAGYVSKDGSAGAWEAGKRRRPLRCSRGWWAYTPEGEKTPIGGLRGAERSLKDARAAVIVLPELPELSTQIDGLWWYVFCPNPDEGAIIIRGTDELGSFEVAASLHGEPTMLRKPASGAGGGERAPAKRSAAEQRSEAKPQQSREAA